MLPLRFYEEHRHEFLDFGAAYDVQLTDGPGVQEAFLAAVEARLAEGETVQVQPGRFSERRDTLDSPVDLETMALLALGIGLAVAGTVAAGLFLARSSERTTTTRPPFARWAPRRPSSGPPPPCAACPAPSVARSSPLSWPWPCPGGTPSASATSWSWIPVSIST